MVYHAMLKAITQNERKPEMESVKAETVTDAVLEEKGDIPTPKRTGTRAVRGAFKPLRNPVLAPDFSTMDPKFMTRSQRLKYAV